MSSRESRVDRIYDIEPRRHIEHARSGSFLGSVENKHEDVCV